MLTIPHSALLHHNIMEEEKKLQFSSIPLLLSLSSILLFTFLFRIFRRSLSSPSKLPPGPRKLPLIGNLHNLANPLPHRALWDLSEKHGPLMHLQLGELSVVVASSPEMAREITKTHDIIFSNRPINVTSEIMSYGSKDIICAPYGPFWRQVRKICTVELLSAKRVQSFRHQREDEYLNLIRWIASNEGTPINLSEKIFSKSFETTSRMAFGARNKENELFTLLSEEVMELASGFDIADLFPSIKPLQLIHRTRRKIERLHKEIDRIVESIIQAHRDKFDRRSDSDVEDNHEDLVDVLLKYERNGDEVFKLTMVNVKAIITDIFGAGSDTSATTVDWAMSEMMRNPELLKKAQAEVRKVFDGKRRVDEEELVQLKFLNMVIKETLRLHPPAPLLLPRESREKCEINGYEIPVGTRVIINGWAINRDPRYWEDAEKFYPERFLDSSLDFVGNSFQYIPFGAGRRICPGMKFGLAVVELALAMLLYHFDWELPGGMTNEDLDMTETFGVTAKRKNALYLIPRVYQDPPPRN